MLPNPIAPACNPEAVPDAFSQTLLHQPVTRRPCLMLAPKPYCTSLQPGGRAWCLIPSSSSHGSPRPAHVQELQGDPGGHEIWGASTVGRQVGLTHPPHTHTLPSLAPQVAMMWCRPQGSGWALPPPHTHTPPSLAPQVTTMWRRPQGSGWALCPPPHTHRQA